jgi:hypothetical protein
MPRDRVAGSASIVLGFGIGVNALLGPLALGIIRFRQSANMETQLLGGELTSLFLAAPLAIAAGILWWRGSSLAPVIALGPAGFALYNYIQFVLVPDYSRYDGNNEYYFPLYLALIVLAWALVWRGWRELSVGSLSTLDRRLSTALGGALVFMSAAFALAWFASIAALYSGPPTREYVEHPTAFWLVRVMDLGFVIPIGFLTGIGLLRRAPRASRQAYAFIGVQVLLTCAVAGMAIRMWVRDDPAVTLPLLVISSGGAAVFGVLYVLVLRSAMRPEAPSRTGELRSAA